MSLKNIVSSVAKMGKKDKASQMQKFFKTAEG